MSLTFWPMLGPCTSICSSQLWQLCCTADLISHGNELCQLYWETIDDAFLRYEKISPLWCQRPIWPSPHWNTVFLIWTFLLVNFFFFFFPELWDSWLVLQHLLQNVLWFFFFNWCVLMKEMHISVKIWDRLKKKKKSFWFIYLKPLNPDIIPKNNILSENW